MVNNSDYHKVKPIKNDNSPCSRDDLSAITTGCIVGCIVYPADNPK